MAMKYTKDDGVTRHHFFLSEEMGSFVNRKIYKRTHIYEFHKTILSCLNCIILITYLIFTNGMFYFWTVLVKRLSDYTMRQETVEQNMYDNVVILHSAVFR